MPVKVPGMLVVYRDDGYWTLSWYRWSRTLMGGRTERLPSRGFVGQVSGSFLAGAPRSARLRSTRLRRIRSTHDARLWRLTCVWVTSPGGRARTLFGNCWAAAGSLWAAVGAVTSRPDDRESTDENKTISTLGPAASSTSLGP